MTIAASELVPRVIMHAPEVPTFLAIQALSDSTRELCRRGDVWTPRADLNLSSGTLTITPPGQAQVKDIFDVQQEGFGRLQAATFSQLNATEPTGWQTRTGPAQCYYRTGDTTLVVYPKPADGATFHVRYTLIPAIGETDFEDSVVSDHEDTILAGAIGRLLVQPNQPWSSANEGGRQLRIFENALYMARSRSQAERTTNVARTVSYGGL